MKRKLNFISQDKEMALIQEMIYRIQMEDPDIHPSNTCFLCVSPDYSSIVTQHLSHALSKDGEIYHIEAVNVPFPDEYPAEYAKRFTVDFLSWTLDWDNFVLIEAGVIRGGNYTWITDIMKEYQVVGDRTPYYTVALCENTGSKFKSDFVSHYYDNTKEDLHFWWERPNNHWECP